MALTTLNAFQNSSGIWIFVLAAFLLTFPVVNILFIIHYYSILFIKYTISLLVYLSSNLHVCYDEVDVSMSYSRLSLNCD